MKILALIAAYILFSNGVTFKVPAISNSQYAFLATETCLVQGHEYGNFPNSSPLSASNDPCEVEDTFSENDENINDLAPILLVKAPLSHPRIPVSNFLLLGSSYPPFLPPEIYTV